MKKLGILFAASVAALAASPGLASPVAGTDALREWNLIVLGNLDSSSEVEGRTFVGGDLTGTSSNYQIGTPTASPTGQPGLTVVGNVTGGVKNLNNGSGAVIGGNVDSGFNLNGPSQTVKVGGTINNTNVNQNVVQSGLAGSDPAFIGNLTAQGATLAGSMKQLSATLSGLSPNSQMDISGNRATFNAAPDADGLAVFSITAADLNSIGEIAFHLNGADTAIVNVSGASINLNDNFLGGTAGLGEHVIWNFGDAQNLDLTTSWGGSVLAPWAAAHSSNYIQGSAVFGSLDQDGEMHLGTYNGGYNPPVTPPGGSSGGTPVPEGPAWLLFILGAGALFFARRRRRSAAAGGM
ncbi:choice-of-anchor A family protein [Sphingobium sp. YBL2]|uniref:choice-of-anchor A family protein n=1 Tax=Sphingobium sp. (strain YBL2) TaxID=484429 RepID=UPI0005CBFBA4|nr:choice-of-anchor A family protein [Sphingobium sp. YBL2]AJR23546.1 glycosyl transferase family 1 [Sphingobium sp. YBL2]